MASASSATHASPSDSTFAADGSPEWARSWPWRALVVAGSSTSSRVAATAFSSVVSFMTWWTIAASAPAEAVAVGWPWVNREHSAAHR